METWHTMDTKKLNWDTALNVSYTANTNDTPDGLHTLHYTTSYSTIVTDVSHTDIPQNNNLTTINTNNKILNT